jgi:hypothetical protein
LTGCAVGGEIETGEEPPSALKMSMRRSGRDGEVHPSGAFMSMFVSFLGVLVITLAVLLFIYAAARVTLGP